MRIVFLSSISLKSPSALGRWFPWARQIASLGHQVHIVALHHNFDASTSRHFRRDGVWVHYVGQMHTRKTENTTYYFNTAKLLHVVTTGAIELTRQVIKIPADIYHICKPHPQNSLAGILATKILNRGRLFLDCDDFEAGINRFSSSWQQPIIAWLEDGLPRLVDGVTVHSRFLENRVQDLGIPSERILRVPSGIDTKRFQYVSSVSTKNWRKHLKLYGSHHIVAFIGTMALVSHPVDLLLKAFAKVSSKQKAILLLVGGGPDLPQLKNLASKLKIIDQTRFVGRVNPNEIPSLLSLADVSVDPVYDDKIAKARWPVKIMESIALGIPVVTGDVGDREEILGGKAGILVSPGSVDALANGLETVLTDSSLRKNLSKGCEIQAAKYDLEDLALQLLTFYGGEIELVG